MKANTDHEAQRAYEAGWSMGQRHARTGHPADMSDARCLPLERERDAAAMALPFYRRIRSGFYAGYEAGYEHEKEQKR